MRFPTPHPVLMRRHEKRHRRIDRASGAPVFSCLALSRVANSLGQSAFNGLGPADVAKGTVRNHRPVLPLPYFHNARVPRAPDPKQEKQLLLAGNGEHWPPA